MQMLTSLIVPERVSFIASPVVKVAVLLLSLNDRGRRKFARRFEPSIFVQHVIDTTVARCVRVAGVGGSIRVRLIGHRRIGWAEGGYKIVADVIAD